MTIQRVVVPFGTFVSAGDFGEIEGITPAVTGSLESLMTALALGIVTGETIAGIQLRVSVRAAADGFTPIWNASADRLRWRVGAGTEAEENPVAEIPKGGDFAWVESLVLWTDPDGAPWTPAAINALQVSTKVGWQVSAVGSVTLDIAAAEAVVYVEREADVHSVAVGAGALPVRLVGGTLRAVAVGAGDLPVAWVGEDE